MKRMMGFFVTLAAMFVSSAAFAQQAAATESGNVFGSRSALALAAGLAIGIASFGGAIGQGRAASTTLEGIARNPEASGKVMTPMIIALALIESLVIYALVIAFLLLDKI